jgi:hypothetical protein
MSRAIALLVVIALTSACASQPKQVELTKIPDDSKVLLNVQQANSKLPDASSDGGTYAKNVGGGVLAGAGMGAIAGFSMGIVCGPAILVCGPIGAMGGAMGGAVFGIGMGTISAVSLQLPQEKAEALDVIIARTLEDLDMTEEVSTTFQTAAASRWNFVEKGAAVEIQIVLESIGLQRHKKDQVTISMATSLLVQTGTGDAAKVEKRAFKTRSPSHHIDYWIDKNRDNFREELQFQLSRHAQNMFAELRAPTWRQMGPGVPTDSGSGSASTGDVAFVGARH